MINPEEITIKVSSQTQLIWTVVQKLKTAYLDSQKYLIWTVVHKIRTAYLESNYTDSRLSGKKDQSNLESNQNSIH